VLRLGRAMAIEALPCLKAGRCHFPHVILQM